MRPALAPLLLRTLAALVAAAVALDAAGRALIHQLPLPAALGYGALVVALTLYAAGAWEPVDADLLDDGEG
jgi:hypothetical protein